MTVLNPLLFHGQQNEPKSIDHSQVVQIGGLKQCRLKLHGYMLAEKSAILNGGGETIWIIKPSSPQIIGSLGLILHI